MFGDSFGRMRGLAGESLDFLRDDGEAASGRARPRCLDRGVERQQIGLRRDRLDQADDFADGVRLFRKADDGADVCVVVAAAAWTCSRARPICVSISEIDWNNSSEARATVATFCEASAVRAEASSARPLLCRAMSERLSAATAICSVLPLTSYSTS